MQPSRNQWLGLSHILYDEVKEKILSVNKRLHPSDEVMLTDVVIAFFLISWICRIIQTHTTSSVTWVTKGHVSQWYTRSTTGIERFSQPPCRTTVVTEIDSWSTDKKKRNEAKKDMPPKQYFFWKVGTIYNCIWWPVTLWMYETMYLSDSWHMLFSGIHKSGKWLSDHLCNFRWYKCRMGHMVVSIKEGKMRWSCNSNKKKLSEL